MIHVATKPVRTIRVLGLSILIGCFAAAVASQSASANSASESLKIVPKPGKVSLNVFKYEEFEIEVSGRSDKHAQLQTFLQTESGSSCAKTAPEEAQREGVSGQNPAQKESDNVEKYPQGIETNFTGSFDWDSNTLEFTKGVKPGVKMICGYISPVKDAIDVPPTEAEKKAAAEKEEAEPEEKIEYLKPYATASAHIVVVKGAVHGYVNPSESKSAKKKR